MKKIQTEPQAITDLANELTLYVRRLAGQEASSPLVSDALWLAMQMLASPYAASQRMASYALKTS